MSLYALPIKATHGVWDKTSYPGPDSGRAPLLHAVTLCGEEGSPVFLSLGVCGRGGCFWQLNSSGPECNKVPEDLFMRQVKSTLSRGREAGWLWGNPSILGDVWGILVFSLMVVMVVREGKRVCVCVCVCVCVWGLQGKMEGNWGFLNLTN